MLGEPLRGDQLVAASSLEACDTETEVPRSLRVKMSTPAGVAKVQSTGSAGAAPVAGLSLRLRKPAHCSSFR